MKTPTTDTIERRIEDTVTNGRGFEHHKNYREDDDAISPYAKLDQQLAYMDWRDGKTKGISRVIEHESEERALRGWVYEMDDRNDKKITDEDRFLYAMHTVLNLLGGETRADTTDEGSPFSYGPHFLLDFERNTSNLDIMFEHISPRTEDKREFDQFDFDLSPGDPLGRVDVPNGTWHPLPVARSSAEASQLRYADERIYAPCKKEDE